MPAICHSAFRILLLSMVALLVLAIIADPALASEAATGLEWETPMDRFVRSITGPIAFAASFLGLVVAGVALVWGGEINEFTRRVFVLIMVISLIVFAGNILRRLFAGGAATIGAPTAEVTVAPTRIAPYTVE